MERMRVIEIQKRKVLENGVKLPPTEAKFWRQKMREEQIIWNGIQPVKGNNGTV